MSSSTTPETLEQILERLTGIYSSKKTYYRELQQTVYDLSTRNAQLEILNRLVTEFRVQESQTEWVRSLGSLLESMPTLTRVILTLREEEHHTTVTVYESGNKQVTMMSVPGDRPSLLDCDPSLPEIRSCPIFETRFIGREREHPWIHILGRGEGRFGVLTLVFRDEPVASRKEIDFLDRFADHLQVCLENALLYRRLRTYRDELRQINRFAIIGEIAAEVAHELNSPLTALLGNAQLLLQELSGGDTKELVKDILSSGLRCKDAVQRLLLVARGGEVHLVPEMVSVERAVEDAIRNLQGLLKEREIDVRVSFLHGPLYIWGVASELVQLTSHLVSNACDAMAGRAVRRLNLCGEQQGSWIFLRISDTGAGIDGAILPDLFKPFVTSKPPGQGTGLGLSSAMRIARKHGGDLRLACTGPTGTTFVVILPAIEQSSDSEVYRIEQGAGRG